MREELDQLNSELAKWKASLTCGINTFQLRDWCHENIRRIEERIAALVETCWWSDR